MKLELYVEPVKAPVAPTPADIAILNKMNKERMDHELIRVKSYMVTNPVSTTIPSNIVWSLPYNYNQFDPWADVEWNMMLQEEINHTLQLMSQYQSVIRQHQDQNAIDFIYAMWGIVPDASFKA